VIVVAPLSLFSRAPVVPLSPLHRQNFRHLYLDIAWFGVLNGSAMSFMLIFATRLGASPFQIGLLSAVPAIVALLFTLPAGGWLQKREISRGVFWSSLLFRLFYASWIFLPWLGGATTQVWMLTLLVLLMSIPGTALAVGFNALFAAAVPEAHRGAVVGRRNALLAITFIATSLLCGVLLEWLPFPTGYQVVFALGAVGALASSYHLYHVRPVGEEQPIAPPAGKERPHDLARPGTMPSTGQTPRIQVGLRHLIGFVPANQQQHLLSTLPFLRIVFLLFFFHLAQHLAIPLFPLAWVNRVGLSDGVLSLGNALFYTALLVGSLNLARLSGRLGNRRLLAIGILGMAAFPVLTALTTDTPLYLVTSLVGGLAWSLAGGAIGNYLLERTPPANRPAYLAWYNLALNAAILLGSLTGPLLADRLGLVVALLIAATGRLLAGLLIWRWG
jgi:MFS family permease